MAKPFRGKNGKFAKKEQTEVVNKDLEMELVESINDDKEENNESEEEIDDGKYYARKNRKYNKNKFYKGYMSGKPSPGNTARKVITAGAKAFFATSEHPMSKLIKGTMRDIFS